MPYNVLHTLSSAREGYRSWERIVVPLARHLDRDRYRISAWYLQEGGPLVDELRGAGAEVEVIGWTGSRRDVRGALRFYRALRRQRWDIVHVHAGAGTLRALVHLASRAAVIQHLHARNSDDHTTAG